MNIAAFKDVIARLDKLHPEDYIAIEKCWKEEISILSEDIAGTIDFVKNECTADEFVWISEIFDEIAIETQSREFIDCLYMTAKKYPAETEKYNVLSFIESAQACIE